MTVDTKPWYLSRTIWLNVMAMVAGLLSAFGVVEITADQADQLAGAAVSIANAVNIVLRLVTRKGVSA